MLYNPKKFIISYVAGWAVWAIVQSAIIHRLGIGWEEAVKDSLISATLFGITCLAPIILYKYYQPGKKNKMYRLFFALGTSVLFCTLFRLSIPLAFSDNDPYLNFLEASMPLRFVISFLMTGFITMINWMWSTVQEQKEFETRRNEAEQLVKDAELSSLRQQLQPHFLFNSLNSISALAGTRPAEARKMIQQLSDFLRGTLKKDEQKIVPLREELEHLSLYLEIEKVRFGHRLNVEIDAGPESTGNTLPPLLLQPIVENAIKFGLYDTTGQITISLRTWMENNYLHIEVKNPFDPKTQNTNQGTGFGLNSIQRRLLLLYGRNDLLGAEKKENQFITRLKIPQLS